MSQRNKEEERIEKIIRGQLKHPENKRCINCNILGPQYVCTTFWTFVCTNCSGIHREFTHRVKSVSMAKFTAEEANGLQAGGNEKARQIYFKTWDPQRNPLPDSSNLHRLRDFIKRVYVDLKYTGERSYDKKIVGKVGGNDDYYGRRAFEQSIQSAKDYSLNRLSLGRASSAGRDDFHERPSFGKPSLGRKKDERSLAYYIEEMRSPRYRQQSIKPNNQKSQSAQFVIVDDRFRDDSFGPRRFESRRFSKSGSGAGSRSPDSQRRKEILSLPDIRPVKDILGDKVPTLKVGEAPKVNDGKDNDGASHGRNPVASGSPHSVDGQANVNGAGNTSSLIDFDYVPEAPSTTEAQQMQDTVASGLASDDSKKNSVPSSTVEKASTAPNVNTLELLLFDLSAPAVTTSEVSAGGDAVLAASSAMPNNVNAIVAESSVDAQTATNNVGTPVSSRVQTTQQVYSSANSRENSADVKQWHSMQHNQPFSINNAQQSTGSSNSLRNQWSLVPVMNSQATPANDSAQKPAQPASVLVQDPSSTDNSKSSGRREIPAYLFTSSHQPFATPIPGWQHHPPHGMGGMGYPVQYHPMAMSTAAFAPTIKSRNPFDIGDDIPPVQVAMFPSMSSLQGALPNMTASTGLQIQPSPYALPPPQQPPSYKMATAPGPQVPADVVVSRAQGDNNCGNTDVFASLNPIQQSAARYSAAATPNSSASAAGMNPFG